MRKIMILSFLILTNAGIAGAQNVPPIYQCIAARLQALDSDNYYNLSVREIDEILQDRGDARHATVVAVAQQCGEVSTHP
jgi:hypothetical protein